MKTQNTRSRKGTFITLGLLMTLILTSLSFNSLQAQTQKRVTTNEPQQGRIIKGIITNEEGPMESASVVLKGTKTGTTTDAKGEFTFPKPLNTGDVLQISFLGFETQEVTIKPNSDFIKLELSSDLVEFVGALNSDTPYKSKRTKD